MSILVANPEERFSREEAQLYMQILKVHNLRESSDKKLDLGLHLATAHMHI